ncbi:LOW QUALITY PROTEIN: phosphatidylinositide phosphatase SAC2-like [Haliotis cracherodii]|uniref:LOW QUALITY PROTEIN: phosphatidylinositide phosphatase SAC2-like n=1 Tax=Haliotis cracherodii TaxID=6455 RepID=UPI0039E8E8AD
MELFQTKNHYIIHNGDHSLWCDRSSGSLEAKSSHDLCSAWNPICIGRIYGVIGKLKIHPESEWKLLLIRQRTLVGTLAKEHSIYKINKIAVLSLSNTDPTDLDLELCKKHHFGIKKPERITQAGDDQTLSLQKTWNTIKSAAENVKIKKKDVKDKEKFERRIIEELLKMYNDSDFFYYSDTYDLTNSLQRQHAETYDKTAPLWRRVDDRFFWNKHMLQELMDTEDAQADPWILPIIQGFVQMERCRMDFDENKKKVSSDSVTDFGNTKYIEPLGYDIYIVSRRSRHRAGTRSKKRGIDKTGACANYVETEQIIEFSPHLVSFVQVRGSIPVYWSQSGFKYRPPPRLDKGEEETHGAFVTHFEEQLDVYGRVVILSLAELSGKETVIGDKYLSHILGYNSPDLTYVTFDFHEYCRGMRFENVSILTDGIRDIIKDQRYSWVDNKGLICEQRGVFRINCVDCLDRTNVVQTAIARIVMETQFRKLGLLPPEEILPTSCRLTYQQLWANNGDVISRQYAGTAALKGDFTRTGERKFSGLMKDGMNSANRYYLRFKDAHRQAAIDLTLGQPVSEEVLNLNTKSDAEEEEDTQELLEKEENVKMLIEDTKKMLIIEPEQCLGGWSLINADPVEGDPDKQEMDIILLLTQRAVYIGWYDDEEEQVTQYQRIFLEDLEKIEIGQEPSVFKSRFVCMRIHYRHFAEEGFFHTFRAPSTRLFNNVVVPVKDKEEARESLKAVCQAFVAAQEILSLELEVSDKPKLERKKTCAHPEIQDIHKQQQENSLAGIRLPRDISSDVMTTSPNTDEAHPAREDGEEVWTPMNSDTHTTQEKISPGQRIKNMNFLPAALRGPFSKPSSSKNSNPIKISLPKMTFQSLNPVKMVKNGPAGKVAIKFSKMLDFMDKDHTDGEVTIIDGDTKPQPIPRVTDTGTRSGSLEAENDVVLGSCGILATSPSNILITSSSSGDKQHRQASSTRPVSNIETSGSSQHTTEEAISEASQPQESAAGQVGAVEVEVFDMDLQHTTDPNQEQEDNLSLPTDIHTNGLPQTSQVPTDHNDITEELHEDHFTKIPPDLDNDLDQDELKTVLDRPKQLFHSNMKVSLSDSSLSLLDDKKSATGGDTSPFAKLKQKVTSLTLPGSGSGGRSPPQPPRGMVRKSQRVLENFEDLVKQKLGNAECQTRIIFI